MDHSSHGSSGGHGDMSGGMAMTFYSSTTTPLFSDAWTPSSPGAYAGSCIFLIVLAILFRAILAGKHHLEASWHDRALRRRYVVVEGKGTAAERMREAGTQGERDAGGLFGKDSDVLSGVLSVNGLEEEVRVVRAPSGHAQPWRFSVDLPRAAIVAVIVGVGYLLMLAVMTMNVGYFLSVIGGSFLGELAFGRFGQAVESNH